MEQFFQRNCGVSLCRDIQNMNGQNPGQLDLVKPTKPQRPQDPSLKPVGPQPVLDHGVIPGAGLGIALC